MEIKLIKDISEFQKLKKGDLILVRWSDNFVRHTPKAKEIMLYNIYQNKTNESNSEIICQKKDNHYFNYNRYLKGLSSALEVHRVNVS